MPYGGVCPLIYRSRGFQQGRICLASPARHYLDTKLNRSDIRSDPTDGRVRPGAALELTITVSRLDRSSCAPYGGVLVDLWQCDAPGVYSGFKDMNGLFDTTALEHRSCAFISVVTSNYI